MYRMLAQIYILGVRVCVCVYALIFLALPTSSPKQTNWKMNWILLVSKSSFFKNKCLCHETIRQVFALVWKKINRFENT